MTSVSYVNLKEFAECDATFCELHIECTTARSLCLHQKLSQERGRGTEILQKIALGMRPPSRNPRMILQTVSNELLP